MKTREEFKRLAFGAISQKFPDLSNENIALADNKLDELYDNELAKEAVTIPEGLGVSDYLKLVKKEASEFAESGKEMLGNIPGNIIPTAKGLAQGVAGFGVDVASGLAQLPTGLISPQAAEEIKYTGKGIKQLIGAEPEQPEYNTIQEAREARELRKKIEQYGEENPTWFSNFKKTIKEQPGSEELMSSAEGLKNFFQKGLTNVADVASIAATGEPIYDEQLAERIIKEPVQVGIETALPLAGMSALLKKGKQATTRYAPIEKPKETFIEELPPTKEIVQGMGEPARNVLAETEYNNLKEQANTLAAKTEVRMLEEQMKENASRAARQAKLEQTLAPISVYDMLIREAEKKAQNEADMLSNISPITAEELAQTAPTLSIRDILQRGQAERGLKQPEIIDEQTGRIIKPTTTPEEMITRLQKKSEIPETASELEANYLDALNNNFSYANKLGEALKILPTIKETNINTLRKMLDQAAEEENFDTFGSKQMALLQKITDIENQAVKEISPQLNNIIKENDINENTSNKILKDVFKIEFNSINNPERMNNLLNNPETVKNTIRKISKLILSDDINKIFPDKNIDIDLVLSPSSPLPSDIKTKLISDAINKSQNIHQNIKNFFEQETIPTEQELKITTPEIGDKIQWQTPKVKGISQTLTGEITDKTSDNRWTVNIDGEEYDFNPRKNTGIKVIQKFQPPELTETEKYNNQIKQENIQKQINEELKLKQQSELIQKYLEEKQNQLQPQQQPLVEPEQANIPLAEQPIVGGAKNNIFKVKLEDIDIEPKRFQFKSNVNKEGVTDLYKGQKFEEPYAGVSTIWLDPKDGRYKMIDGHHRYNMAKESKHPFLNVQLANDFGVETEAQARIFGAFKNIADDRGTPFDAAKIMRELNLKKLSDFEGLDIKVNPRQKTFSQGFKLAKLSDLAWEGVRNNVITENIGALLSDLNETQQNSVFKQIASYKDKYGVLPEPDKISSLIDNVKTMDVTPTQEYDMFGNVVETQPVWERAGLVSSILNELKQRKRIDKISTNEKISNRLEEKGTGKLNKEVGEQELANTLTTIDMFNKLKDVKGNIADKLNEGARRIAAGESETKIKKEVLDDVERTILDEYSKYYKTSPRVQSEPTGAGETIDIFGSTEKITPEQPSLNNFITNEEGFINPAKLFDFLFKSKGGIDNPIETDPNLKKYNQDMQAGYEAGEQKLIERNVKAEKLKPDWWTKIITEVVKKEYPITSLQNKIEKRGINFSDEKNIKLLADAFTYLPTKIQGYLYTVEPKVLGINPDTMGKIMQMQRIVTERKDITNRYTPIEAEQYLNYIKENMPNEWVKYESAMNQIQKNRQEFIIPELKASRLFPEQLINKIENNLNYSTNQVVKYIDSQRTGNRMTGATAQILQQIGSGEEISNPYKTTILKDISLLQAAKLNSLKLAGVDFLLEYFPEMIQKAKPKFLGESKYKVLGRPGEIKTKPIIQYEEPKEAALSTLWLRRDGKSEAYYIRKDIVDALNMKSDQPNAIAKNINNINNIFKNTWIRYNYKFWLPAFAKDIIDTFIFMPTYKGKKEYFKQIIPAIGKAVKSVFGADPMSDPQIREYYKAAIFNPEKRSAAWSMAEVEPFERTLKSYDINLDKEAPKSFLQSMTSPLKNITNKYSELGSILERANKFAVNEALKNVKIKGKILTPEEVNLYSRRLGSPAFLASGKQTKNLQALFPFINPVVQGLDAAYSLGKLDPIGVASSLTALSMLSAYGVAAGLGYLGKEKEEEYKNLTDNEKNNFFNVLGSNIKIPIGFMYKPIHKLMTSFAKNDPLAFKDFFVTSWGSTILDELPTFSPVVNLGFDISAILEGQRIYDYYRGYHPIERTAEQAQTTDTALEYLKYFFNKYGGGSYYRMGEEEQNYAPWQRFVRTQKEKESGEKQRLYGAVNKADILYARSKLASMQKAKGEKYDETQKILPKEYIKTKKAERIENLKLPLKTKAMMKILNEPDFYKKSLLIKQFKKEGLLNE